MTSWFLRHGIVIGCLNAAIVLAGVILYKAPEVAYLYRANQVLATAVSMPPESISSSDSLKHYCPQLSIEIDGSQSRVCSNEVFLHPYLNTTVSEYRTSDRLEPTILILETTLPKGWRTPPLHLAVIKDFRREGNQMHIKQIPSDLFPKGVRVLLESNASPNLRLNYSCALPFRSCRFSEYMTIR